jgi:hypothetical protein
MADKYHIKTLLTLVKKILIKKLSFSPFLTRWRKLIKRLIGEIIPIDPNTIPFSGCRFDQISAQSSLIDLGDRSGKRARSVQLSDRK